MTTSPVCVDANIVVALVTAEHLSPLALALWREWVAGDQQPTAPPLLRYEVAAALYRKVRQGAMDQDDARQALQKALALDIRFYDPRDLPLRAFDLAARLGQSAAYDAQYLAVAEQLGCPLWTADERLFNAVRADFPLIRWLGGYHPA